MEAKFWHERWDKNQIGFHESEGNQLLMKHIGTLKLAQDNRIFIPLCGKTKDIGWLRDEGYKVVGIELNESAVIQLFEDLGQTPNIEKIGSLTLYSIENTEIYVGDFFQLSKEQLGHVDAVYDRAALVALPDTMREEYTSHLLNISTKVPQLLITYEYDQNKMSGPPFSITTEMVTNYYQDTFTIAELDRTGEKMKGKVDAANVVWFLTAK